MRARPRRHIEAIVWDLDGTLVDTISIVFAASRYAVDRWNPGVFSDEDLWGLFGRPAAEVWLALAPEPALAPRLDADYGDYYARHRSEMVTPVPGAFETLDRLRSLGVRQAVLSNKERAQGEAELAADGLAGFFEVTIWAEDQPRPKPFADGLLLALDRLGVTPSGALMVGDGAMDILCARNAGVMAVAAVWTGLAVRRRSELETLAPDFLLTDIHDILGLVSPE